MDGNSTSSTPTSPSATQRNPSSKPWPKHTARQPCLPQEWSSATPADRGGQPTPEDHAFRDTINMLRLVDMTADLKGQPSHFPHQGKAAHSRIDVYYGDPTPIIGAEARNGPLPPGRTGHKPLHLHPTIPNLPPNPPEAADQGLLPPLKMPPLHDKQAWSQYHRAISRAR